VPSTTIAWFSPRKSMRAALPRDFVLDLAVAGGVGGNAGGAARDLHLAEHVQFTVGTAGELLGAHGRGLVLVVATCAGWRSLRVQWPRGHGDKGGEGSGAPRREGKGRNPAHERSRCTIEGDFLD
jgi:hypothetical protein